MKHKKLFFCLVLFLSQLNLLSFKYNLNDLSNEIYEENKQNVIAVSQGSNNITTTNNYDQWGLYGENGIHIEEAWELIGNGYKPNKVTVGILEGNMQLNHPDIDYGAYISVPNGNKTEFHGTHMAGIIGAINNDIGIDGVAQVKISLLAISPFDNKNGDDFITSFNWATKMNIKIINASYINFKNATDYADYDAREKAVIKSFGDNNGLLICSAGNYSKDNDEEPPYPSSYSDSTKYPDVTNVISVGALNRNGDRYYKSNYGKNSVDIYAPGEDIYSTIPNSSYGVDSGTSQATAFVSGVAALLLSISADLTNTQIKEAILNGSDTITITLPDNTKQTVKKLNAFGAVKYVLNNWINFNSSYTLSYYDSTFNKDIFKSDLGFSTTNIIKLNSSSYDYKFSISSNYQIRAILFDKNLNKISTSSKNNSIELDSISKFNICYLKIDMSIPNSNIEYSTVTINAHCHKYIDHYCECGKYTSSHNHNSSYIWLNYRWHTAACICGDTMNAGHVISKNSYAIGTQYYKCVFCGGLAEMGFTQDSIPNTIKYVTDNGSFILFNDIIVLDENDIKAYTYGVLKFN